MFGYLSGLIYVTYHPQADEIARFAAGALVPQQAAKVGMHVEGCARCRKASERVAAVKRALASATYPPMPDHLAARVEAAIAAESARRSGERAARMRELGARIEESLLRGDLEEAHELAEGGLTVAPHDYDTFHLARDQFRREASESRSLA